MLIDRKIEIERPLEEVFDFVADACNDPRWCPKVISVEAVASSDDRFEVVHKPVPGRPERSMEMSRVAVERPVRIEWLQDDGTDVFRVTYSLSSLEDGRTRMKQTSAATIGAPRVLRPLYRAGIGRDIAGQLRRLKRLLES